MFFFFFPFHVKMKLKSVSPKAWPLSPSPLRPSPCACTCDVPLRDGLAAGGRRGGAHPVLTEGGMDEETWLQTFQKPLQNIWVCQDPKPRLPGTFPASV